MVFALAWNLRRRDDNVGIMLLGAASLAIGLMDLGHVLSYAGMPDLVTPSSPHKTIVFWLAGRALAAVVFVLLGVLTPRHWSGRAWYAVLACAVAMAAAVWWVGAVTPEMVPATFLPGSGLTGWKIAAEYAIAATYAAAAVLLFRQARRDGSAYRSWLGGAAWVLTLSELLFTRYANLTDVFNLLGHVFKVVAYLMVYRAVFVTGVQEPYRQLARERSLLRSLIDSMPDLIFFKNRDSVYIGANTAFRVYSGLSERELVGRRDEELTDAVTASRFQAADRRVIETGSIVRREEWIPFHGGGRRLFDTVKTPFVGPDGEQLGLIGVSRDITDQRATEALATHLEEHDRLTGLLNRDQLTRRTAGALEAAAARGGSVAMLLIDVDDFRSINDSLGHRIGDAVLVQLAARLRQAGGPDSTVSRLGADQFLVMMVGTTAAEAAAMALTCRQTVNVPLVIGEYELIVTASVGIAMFPDAAGSVEELLLGADSAIGLAKSDRPNTTQFYDPSLRVTSAERLDMLAGLRRAVRDGEFVLHYQPQVSLHDDRITGAEALLRWAHPQLGLLPPAAFVDLAERSGLIVPIGEWVLRQAVTDMQAWLASGLSIDSVAVNVSAEQFRLTDLPRQVRDVLRETGLPPGMLELELTESVALRNPEAAVAAIADLHQQGVRIAIDDFGTGYSSLAYLSRFRIDRVKVDRSFVAAVRGGDGEGAAIVRAIIELARSLGCVTVAEGVEDPAQLAFVRAEGCQFAQGYLLGRPVPAADLCAVLMRQALTSETAAGLAGSQ